jgi:hypothetical protein
MYIKKVHIKNIRSISDFTMDFGEQPAGWHVLIGDNGAGKSSVVRSIALALVGPEQALGLRADWRDWLNRVSDEGLISLFIEPGKEDKQTGRSAKVKNQLVHNELIFKKSNGHVSFSSNINPKTGLNPLRFNWGTGGGWFSVAYGPYRRFEGGNQEWTKVFYAQPKLGAHLSVFGEDVALTEALDWLVKLNYQILEQKEDQNIIEHLKMLINSQIFYLIKPKSKA